MLKYTIKEVNRLINLAAEATGVNRELILSPERSREVVKARQWVMYHARQRGHSFPNIGMAMDRDHSTIIHGVRAHAQRMKGN